MLYLLIDTIKQGIYQINRYVEQDVFGNALLCVKKGRF
jgi:hypothetical protein